MKPYRAVVMGIALAIPLWAGLATAQNKAACDAAKASSPQQVEGKVVRIDQAANKVVVEANGKTHEFQASKETLQDLKVGDTVNAQLRSIPGCN